MNALPLIPRPSLVLLMALLPLTPLLAGDDGTAVRPENVSVTTQMNDYLQGQKITHSVEAKGGDAKGEGAETLTVKIYDVTTESQQNAICTALTATAKKSHVRETTVLFYNMAQAAAAQTTGFQPSRLPSGNGEVEFPRDTTPAGYKLSRTVKL